MSGTRNDQHPWLTDHVIFFCYRWLAWGIACAFLLTQLTTGQELPLFLTAVIVNLVSTLLAQPYVRAARRTPALMGVDVLIMVLLFSGRLAFLPYALSSLVLPGLLFGWRGGIMAGLLFVTISQTAALTGTQPPSILIERGEWAMFLIPMAAPPLFGSLFPSVVELLRYTVAERRRRQQGRRSPAARSWPDRELRAPTISRVTMVEREAETLREQPTRELPQPSRTTTLNAAEQGLEDLRRVIFAPMPMPDLDLPAALDLLATRFRQHTGTSARLTLLGRSRFVHHAQRGALLRLAQESLLNVQQHAHAAALEMTLRYDTSSVALLIQDDGVGLLDGTHERPGLHALRAMHYRLAELGGRLDVFETEGGGVTVRATMPLE